MWRRADDSKYQRLEGTPHINLHTTLNMEVAVTSETTAPLCQTTKTSGPM
jgi:hypothetical protein